MAGSVNKVILIGRLARDPEVRSMQSGGRVCNLTVVTSESWTDKSSGERKEKAEFHRVVIFDDRLVDVCEKYAAKGRLVYVEGQLQTRKWQKNGEDRYQTEVVLQKFRGEVRLLDKAGDDTPVADNARATAAEGQGRGGGWGDDIPFAPF